jgi:predicted dehydrogenase
LKKASIRHPGARTSTDYRDVLSDPDVKAVVIATPVDTHATIALDALNAGKHVLVTKPITSTSAEAERIIKEAEKRGLVLMVDHTFVYMGAVQKVREIVRRGDLGDLYYFDSVRVNLGLYQRDVSVLWDLAVHDLSIIDAWIDRTPRAVSCITADHLPGHPADIAYLTLLYDDNLIVHIHVNWLSPVKVRRILLGGSKKMIVFDDLDPVEKIKVYDRGVTPRQDLVSGGLIPLAYRRTGDVWMPEFDLTEALRVEAKHFIRCVHGEEQPRTDAVSAQRIVKIIETAEQSARDGGRAIPFADLRK